MIHQSRKESDYYAGEGRSDGPREMEAAATIYNRYWESNVTFLSKPSFSLPIELYLGIGQYRLPALLRWLVTALIKLCLFPARFAEAIKRKLRSRYYEWKK
jgi:hypothetical protein